MNKMWNGPFPRLTTERLKLRQFALEDAPMVQQLAGAKEIARYTSLPHPYEDGMAESWIKKQHEDFEAGSIVNFALIRGKDDQLIGSMGLTISSPHLQAELGYWIGLPFWGQGYCTEAARRVIAYGFHTLDLHRICARHMGTNHGSGSVLKKIGMQWEGRQRHQFLSFGAFEDCVLYGMLKTDYEAIKWPR